MKFGAVPIAESVGKILAHNIVNNGGHKILSKGHVVKPDDLTTLAELNLTSVVVADLEPTDLSENEAARRVGMAIAGSGVKVVTPGAGRANLIADETGPLKINVATLDRLNLIDEGMTIATLREHTLVQPGELVALVKIIPFGVQAIRVADIESAAQSASPVLSVRPLRPCSVALIISGPASAKDRLIDSFQDVVRQRVEKLSSTLDALIYVEHEAEAIAGAIQAQAGRDLILIASISAIIDREDVVPTAVRSAGGTVAHFGVPVDPGSLLMLGYLNDVPIIGAPGCIKSPKTNVIDWIMPRLIAGERLTRADLVAMGHGGLLDDISERPMPR